ncbi:MAG: Asd/ArgC dimerization domain-containing protein [Bryobacteraceae bacterium]
MAEAVALVGSDTLMGRELRDLLAGSVLGENLRLIAADDEAAGILTEQGGEPSLVTKLEASSFDGASAVLLAGSDASTLQVLDLKPGASLIDLTHAAEERPNARLRAPMVEPHDYRVAPDAINVVAHPAAIALALALGRIHAAHPIRRSIVHVFEPASERGLSGINELQEQTVNLLSFKPLPKKVFDNQLSYTLLARLGEEAPVQLSEIESRIERHLTTLLSISSSAPIPSLRLIQAPVFHGYSFSLWIEFIENPGAARLEIALAGEPFDLRASDGEPPNNVGVAGQNGVAIGAIAEDRNCAQALWVWMAADNLRLAAENAVQVAREVA